MGNVGDGIRHWGAVAWMTLVLGLPWGAVAGEPPAVGMFIQGVDENIARAMGLDRPQGVLVRDIALGGPADKGGFLRGDLLVGFAGQPVESVAMMQTLMGSLAIGREIQAVVLRQGHEVTLALIPEPRSEKLVVSRAAVHLISELGLTLSTLTQKVRERFGIRWSSTGLVVTLLDEARAFGMDLRPGEVIVQVDQMDVWEPEQIVAALGKAKSQGRSALLVLVEGTSGFRFSLLPVR